VEYYVEEKEKAMEEEIKGVSHHPLKLNKAV
jgi:hypothetical protein